MRLSRQVTCWVGARIAAGAAFWLVRDILLPFVAGMALAYLLDPLANRLERLGVSRLWATLAILAIFVVLFLLLIIAIGPILAHHLMAFLERLPSYASRLQAIVTDPNRPWLSKIIGDEGFPDAEQAIAEFARAGAGWLAAFVRSLWAGGQALLSLFALLVVTPVVAFYLIYDWNRMVAGLDRWTPIPYRATVRELAREVDAVIAGFVRGQTGVCLILGAFYAVALSLVGLHFGLLIGIVAGLITVIPYVGSLTGLLLAGGVAMAQFFPDWIPILTVIGVFLAGQFLEGNVLAPKLVGKSVGLHPVWLMFALFAFGSLFGFVGLLIAVPVAAAIGVLVRFALRQYLASPLYTGVAASEADGPEPRMENG
ncbi:MAG: AI-2E family transporter [Rhodospirillales bacterium]|nr:AI-2E family transporter [Rhodospirillales bacterium]